MATQGILQKPRMSFWQIWNMSFGFLGIQFGFALQTGYASSILLKFGAKVDNLSWFWLAAPLTGMIIQPIIGHYSDRTWNRLGRRRPYFLTGAILSGLALCFLPNSSGLAFLIPPIIVGAGMLMLMDASFNVAMEPFRALVADNLPDSQHNTGFSLQTCLIGVGAIMGSFLPSVLAEWFHVSDVAPKGIVPNNLLYSFYAGGIVLIGCILWTVIKTKEYPPEEYAKFHEPDKEVAKKSGISEFFDDLVNMPKTMRQLGVVQFFSWFALFSMWVFTTSAVAAHVYHLPASDTSSHQYSVASDWVGKMFGVYNAVSAVYALSLPFIVKKFNRKKTHAFSLTMGGIGLISVFFIQNQYLLLLSMIGVGLAWGSILAMPYAILSSSIPAKKIGLYMGLFNFFITFPQIVNSLTSSLIIKYLFHSEAIYGLIMAGVFMFLAAISVLFVQDGKDIQIIEAA
ncbi:MFS transporter [Mucilaginibacter sp. X4EP1]|uniref:MFS transporter n=1 Tax=Mucilaginibacter sp. X4EP1 TaxID=2723092 RepID=UPI002169DD88|nr:MFS transporter [Mucilaginibacter sp. X4EP1]MCS3812343.1 maltose/moltooligosaccharide transporter [Mucilaginibacter sp. X4EP1]